MIIPVSSNGKKLIDSGVFNGLLMPDNSVILHFNYEGLNIKLIINCYFENQTFYPNVTPYFHSSLEAEGVVLRQPIRMAESYGNPYIGSGGMLAPYEIGVKQNGKKIYMTWGVTLMRTAGGGLVSTTSYSFYEDM